MFNLTGTVSELASIAFIRIIFSSYEICSMPFCNFANFASNSHGPFLHEAKLFKTVLTSSFTKNAVNAYTYIA